MKVQLCNIIALSAVLASCGGQSPNPTTPSPQPAPPPAAQVTLSSVRIEGPASVNKGVYALTAVATLSDGTQKLVSEQAVWESSNTVVALVSGPGLVVARGFGVADVVATYQGVEARLPFTVSPNPR